MDELQALIERYRLAPDFTRTIDVAYRPIARRIAAARAQAGRAIVVGVCGAQGSGKSTLTAFTAILLRQAGLKACVLALDDLYLSAEARAELARTTHPLLRTRGVPGTHEVDLGVRLLDELTRPAEPHDVALPRFDKAADTRAPQGDWPVVRAPVDVVLFEGWCVGARPQAAAELDAAINVLERERDRDGRWRRYVNDRLAGDYRRLFAAIDLLILLQAPAFERVFAWRALQERKLAEDVAGGDRRAMGDDDLKTFIMHYERLTRHILTEMPARADILVKLGDDQSVEDLEMRDIDRREGIDAVVTGAVLAWTMCNWPCPRGARRRRAPSTPACSACPNRPSRPTSPSAAAAGSFEAS